MKRFQILCLGAGVQSSTLALMSARGDLPRLDVAIFADTGDEPAAVYRWLEWLETQLPFPVVRARRPGGTLADMAIDIAHNPGPMTANPPWFTEGPRAMLRKHCSTEFKTRVVEKEIRTFLGLEPGQRGPKEIVADSWLGISLDEMQRMKRSNLGFVENVFPLVDRRIKRTDCLKWMAERQYPKPPKSSCVYCPFRGDDQWRDMRDNHPEDWARAVQVDKAIRPGFHGMTGQAFVHRQRVPLDEVDLSTAADRGQIEFGFLDECEGMCGV